MHSNVQPLGTRRRALWCVALVAGLLSALVAADEPTKRAKGTDDAFGDPVPESALVRMGTLRFRNAGGDRIAGLTYSPDGKRIVSADPSMNVTVWDAESGKKVNHFGNSAEGRGYEVCLKFVADGKLLVGDLLSFGPRSSPLTVWDLEQGKELLKLEGSEGMFGVAVSPDGKTVAGTTRGKPIRLWDVANGKVIGKCEGHNNAFAVAFSPDGKCLATGGFDQKIHVWEIDKWKEVCEIKPSQRIYSLAYTADGKTLVAGDLDETVTYWEPGKASHVRQWSTHLLDPVNDRSRRGGLFQLAFSPNGEVLATRNQSNGLQFWDAATGKKRRVRTAFTLQGEMPAPVAFHPDSKRVAFGSGPSIRVWDLTKNEDVHETTHHEALRCVQFTSDGKRLISADRGGTILRWDAETSKLEKRLGDFRSEMPIALSPNGKWAVHDTGDKPVLLDVETGKNGARLPGAGRTHVAAFSPDSKWVAVSGLSGAAVKVWDVVSGKEARLLESDKAGGKGAKMAYRYNPGAQGLAFGSRGRFAFTDAEGRVAIGTVSADRIRTVGDTNDSGSEILFAFSPNARTMAVALARGKSATLWEVASGKPIRTITCRAGIASLTFTTSGNRLVAGSTDGAIAFHDVDTGKEFARLEGHKGAVTTLAFSHDRKKLASGSDDTTVLIWDLARIPLDAKPVELNPTDKELNALWNDLASSEADKANRAIAALACVQKSPALFAAKFEASLKPVPDTDAKTIAAWLAELDDDDPKIRAAAEEKLSEASSTVEKALEDKLEGQVASLELRRRLQRVLDTRVEKRDLREIRWLRVLEVLETLGTAEAKAVLKTIGGTDKHTAQAEAKDTLEAMGD